MIKPLIKVISENRNTGLLQPTYSPRGCPQCFQWLLFAGGGGGLGH
jgi:hypothetical protein